MNYFQGLKTVSEVKSEYRKLAKANHPDIGGVTAVMQAINAAYHAVLARLDGQVNFGSDGKEHTYRYSREVEQEVIDKVSELLKIPGVEVEIIGTWVWVSGDTKPVKEQLKEAGCSWHSKRLMWYWRRFTYRRKFSGMDIDDMRKMYGNQRFEKDTNRAMVPA